MERQDESFNDFIDREEIPRILDFESTKKVLSDALELATRNSLVDDNVEMGNRNNYLLVALSAMVDFSASHGRLDSTAPIRMAFILGRLREYNLHALKDLKASHLAKYGRLTKDDLITNPSPDEPPQFIAVTESDLPEPIRYAIEQLREELRKVDMDSRKN